MPTSSFISSFARRRRAGISLAVVASSTLGLVVATSSPSTADWGRSTPSVSVGERRPVESPSEEPDKVLNRRTADSAEPTVTTDDVSIESLTFVPISPYRALDSRAFSDGDMLPGDEVYFEVWTDQNGVPRIPSNVKAVAYNLTVTNTFGVGGYLSLFPANINWPGNSSINWFGSGLDLANGGIVAVGNFDGPGQVSVYAGVVPRTATYFLLDITGYFV